MSDSHSSLKQLLAFVIDKKYDVIYLHMDSEGLDCLIRELGKLKANLDAGKCEHFHMFSEEWGDGQLSMSTMGNGDDDGRPIHQLNAYAWTDEYVKKYGFEKS